jgi:ankyrin repeat protein
VWVKKGYAPLRHAAKQGHSEICRHMIKIKLHNKIFVSFYGKTPYQIELSFVINLHDKYQI